MMIKTALVALTVVGCDCDARLCEYIGETPARWTSVAACEAAMREEIATRRDLNYPLVTGICVERPGAPDAAAQAGRTGPAANDRFDTGAQQAAPGLTERVTHGAAFVLRRTADGYAFARGGLSAAAQKAGALFSGPASILPAFIRSD